MTDSPTKPIDQSGRPPCLFPLVDGGPWLEEADLALGNSNWTRGLQAMSEWVWSANLNPAVFPNNLGRFLLHIPGVFEQQLNYSATLIFDEPSFRNGVQVSGFVPRIARELAISLIAQRRRSWYSMTHHAVLGRLTANKHGLGDSDFLAKWGNLTEHEANADSYSELEREVLAFADAFSSDPKAYPDERYQALRRALSAHNAALFRDRPDLTAAWLVRQDAARAAYARALAAGCGLGEAVDDIAGAAAGARGEIDPAENERLVDSAVVELAFVCLQFVALTCVFTGLTILDEDFLPGVMEGALPPQLIQKINVLNQAGAEGIGPLLPPRVELPVEAILAGDLVVEPAPLRGARVPLVSYEDPGFADRDKGLTVGGANVGVYGWGFGAHFPGNLVYLLLHHPELARYEPPYSLPVLFNEDEWRNGVQTGGYVSRLIKEIVIQKVYKLNRARYGLEHHTMFLFNAFADEYGVGRTARPDFSAEEQAAARAEASRRAEGVAVHVLDHRAPAAAEFFGPLELALLDWTEALVSAPHSAHRFEPAARAALRERNSAEVAAGLRRLDDSPGGAAGEGKAMDRLVDHQIADLCMMVGHMDGLGRAMSILRLESEGPAQLVEGKLGPDGRIAPDLDADGCVRPTGAHNTRFALLDILRAVGVTEAALTANELLVNPAAAAEARRRLDAGETGIRVTAADAAASGEF